MVPSWYQWSAELLRQSSMARSKCRCRYFGCRSAVSTRPLCRPRAATGRPRVHVPPQVSKLNNGSSRRCRSAVASANSELRHARYRNRPTRCFSLHLASPLSKCDEVGWREVVRTQPAISSAVGGSRNALNAWASPLATCAPPKGVCYLLTYLRRAGGVAGRTPGAGSGHRVSGRTEGSQVGSGARV